MADRFYVAGSDLLRKRDNTRRKLSHRMGAVLDGWYTRKFDAGTGKPAWDGPVRKAEVLNRFDSWQGIKDQFVVARKAAAGIEPEFHAEFVDVTVNELPNCSPETSLVNALIHTHFPQVVFAGAYVYKMIEGTSDWSDHAWGTAVDETQHLPETPNDAVFDWLARMGRTGCMNFDYALGSKDNHVVQCVGPDFDVEPSNAASSHLWHVHISVVDHHGEKPPHEGGAF